MITNRDIRSLYFIVARSRVSRHKGPGLPLIHLKTLYPQLGKSADIGRFAEATVETIATKKLPTSVSVGYRISIFSVRL